MSEMVCGTPFPSRANGLALAIRRVLMRAMRRARRWRGPPARASAARPYWL